MQMQQAQTEELRLMSDAEIELRAQLAYDAERVRLDARNATIRVALAGRDAINALLATEAGKK